MAKITKERAEQVLNAVIELARDYAAESDPMHYSYAETIKSVREAIDGLKWGVQCLLNKDTEKPVAATPSKPYVSLQLKKSFLTAATTEKGQALRKAMAEMEETLELRK